MVERAKEIARRFKKDRARSDWLIELYAAPRRHNSPYLNNFVAV
jgi:hypothetical protein